MSALGNVFNVKVRVAFVTLGFVAGLAVVGAAEYVGAGKIAEASADADALSALNRAAGEIGAAAMALRGVSVRLRYTRGADAVKSFADGSKDLAAKLDQFAASPHDEALSAPIDALKGQIEAIGKPIRRDATDAADGRRFRFERAGRQSQRRRSGAARRAPPTPTPTSTRSKASRCAAPSFRCCACRCSTRQSFDEHLKGKFEASRRRLRRGGQGLHPVAGGQGRAVRHRHRLPRRLQIRHFGRARLCRTRPTR